MGSVKKNPGRQRGDGRSTGLGIPLAGMLECVLLSLDIANDENLRARLCGGPFDKLPFVGDGRWGTCTFVFQVGDKRKLNSE